MVAPNSRRIIGELLSDWRSGRASSRQQKAAWCSCMHASMAKLIKQASYRRLICMYASETLIERKIEIEDRDKSSDRVDNPVDWSFQRKLKMVLGGN